MEQLARMFPDMWLVYDDYMFSLLVCVTQGTMRMCPAIILGMEVILFTLEMRMASEQEHTPGACRAGQR